MILITYYWPLHQSNPRQRRAKIAAWTSPSKGGGGFHLGWWCQNDTEGDGGVLHSVTGLLYLESTVYVYRITYSVLRTLLRTSYPYSIQHVYTRPARQMTSQGCEIGRGVRSSVSLSRSTFWLYVSRGSIATCPLPEIRGNLVTGRRYYSAHSEILLGAYLRPALYGHCTARQG